MPERARAVPRTSERLGRMLAIVPYLVQHPGSALGEVASAFGLEPAQLRRDLDLLFLSGLPPYGPGDLIDVDVDEDGRIWISMADHFSRPLKLTRSEALAIYLRGTELLATPGVPDAPALAAALEKLRASLGPETIGEARGRIEIAAGGRAPEHLAILREAAAAHERVRIEYFALSTGERSRRTIEPEEVFSDMGHWYVAAWDVDADDERLFRADRVRAVEGTGETFRPRGLRGAGRDLYSPTGEDVAVRLRLGPAARWIAEYYATSDVHELDDGGVEVTLPARQLGWVARLVLRVGDEAEVIDPPELRAEVARLAEATLARYGEKT
ncbi:MAG TPA: WYL domain-containing protein [Actinomycetota bacterium]|nr:WYL domain-containing protein [Actinomycetota bacterium]